MSSDFNLTVTSWFLGNVRVKQKPVEVKNYWHGEGGQYIEKSAYLNVRLLWMIPKLTPCTEQAKGSTKAALKGSIPNHHMILRVPNFQNT